MRKLKAHRPAGLEATVLPDFGDTGACQEYLEPVLCRMLNQQPAAAAGILAYKQKITAAIGDGNRHRGVVLPDFGNADAVSQYLDVDRMSLVTCQ